MKGLAPEDLEDVLRPHLTTLDATSAVDAAGRSDQSGEFEEQLFSDGLAESLAAGASRLVLVLDEAPSELRQLKPGHRLFVYIPKGNGVGGYVGAGNVVGEARLVKDFTVQRDGQSVPYLEVARAAGAGAHADDPGLAEWIVPVEWLATRKREEAIKDSDFFANQNSAVKLTHGYTLERLVRAFDLEHA